MSAAAPKVSPVASIDSERTLSPFPSPAALRLEQTPMRGLEQEMVRGGTPALDDLVGWEFRGINHLPLNVLPLAQLAGIKKFVKGFHHSDDGRVMGYNRSVRRNALDGRWHVSPKKYGFFEVAPVDATTRDNAYLHALLFDYSKGDNAAIDPSRGLRDYLVQLDRDLFLGKAYYALGPLRIATSFFILERHRRGLTDYAKRQA